MKMISRKLYFAGVSLILCSLNCCVAKNAPDPSDIAVEVFSQLEPVVRLLLSAEELRKWNESVMGQQHPMCIDDVVKELLINSEQLSTDDCFASLEEIFEHEPLISSGDSEDPGSGRDDDAEIFSVGALSKVFCNQACGSLLFLAYDTCKLLDRTVGEQLTDILCRKTSKDELCLEVLAGSSFPTALSNCTAEKGCEEKCKQGLEQVSNDFGCCLVGSALSEQCELPELECKGLPDTGGFTDTGVVTSSNTLISVLSVCLVSVILNFR